MAVPPLPGSPAPPLPPKRQLMPGSFESDDDSISEDNPFLTLEGLQDEWRNREHRTPWSADKFTGLDLGNIDWHKYEPPSLLRKTPTVTSQILLDIVASSIDNVKARVEEQVRQKKDVENERLRVAEEERQEAIRKKRSEEPYLPIIIVEEPSSLAIPQDDASVASVSTDPRVEPLGRTAKPSALHRQLTVSAMKAEKRRRFALRRLFQRHEERGESSSMGATRETLREKVEDRLGNINFDSADLQGQETISAWRNSKFLKAPSIDELVECVSCLDDIPRNDAIKVPCHSYCADCFVRLVSAAIQHEQQWPPKCCLTEIPFRLILKHIPNDLKKTFQERSSEWEIPITERVYCHQPECGVWIHPSKISLSQRQGCCENGHRTCSVCRGSSHGTGDCPEDREMTLTNLLAEEEGWKRCFKCNALVEHREACQHMTCRCGTQFCYVCGRRWRSCGCTMQQLQALKEAADTRREQRQLKEQAEEEELRQMLAQIEEFERNEAIRAELERQDQERQEEQRWQRQIKEKIRQETRRRKEVECKYNSLRSSLDQLHEVQLVMMDVRQETDAKDLVVEGKTILQQLSQNHKAQREDLDLQLEANVAAKDHAFSKEYASRAVQEKKIEEGYHRQLQAFWCTKVGGEEEVEMAMITLRKQMDARHRAWQKWKSQRLDAYRTQVEDENTIRQEIMYSITQRTKGYYEEKETELVRRSVAERKWMQEIIYERERMLGEGEVEEMEGDADSLFTAES